MADILGMIGTINVFGTILFIYVIAFRLKKEIRKRYIIYYALIWAIIYVSVALVVLERTGTISTGAEIAGAAATNIVSFFIAFLILDMATFYICRLLYRRVPSIQAMLNKGEIEEEIQQKHKTKDKK